MKKSSIFASPFLKPVKGGEFCGVPQRAKSLGGGVPQSRGRRKIPHRVSQGGLGISDRRPVEVWLEGLQSQLGHSDGGVWRLSQLALQGLGGELDGVLAVRHDPQSFSATDLLLALWFGQRTALRHSLSTEIRGRMVSVVRTNQRPSVGRRTPFFQYAELHL